MRTACPAELLLSNTLVKSLPGEQGWRMSGEKDDLQRGPNRRVCFL